MEMYAESCFPVLAYKTRTFYKPASGNIEVYAQNCFRVHFDMATQNMNQDMTCTQDTIQNMLRCTAAPIRTAPSTTAPSEWPSA